MLTPSPNFNALRERPGNHITQKCVIDIGNFALRSKGAFATASSQYSADWPASGVVNGDRTHINAGAASASENKLGGSVWRGSAVSDGSGNIAENILVDLGIPRRINRIRLIFWPGSTKNGNLGSIAPKDFLIKRDGNVDSGYGDGGFGLDDPSYNGLPYGGGSLIVPWTGLVDKSPEIGKSPVTIASGQVTGSTNDMVVFEDPLPQTCQKIQIFITKLQAAGANARIVAIEITLAVDISDAVTAMSRQMVKDYHLERRQATLLQLTLRNHDGRFNDRMVPTDAQVETGFFNNYIRPNLEIRYFAGFSGVNAQMFSGFVDIWKPLSSAKSVALQARDFYKFLVKPTISTPIKSGWSLEALVELVANYQNFPSNLMILDTTTIYPTLFAPNAESVRSVLNKLQDATGDAEIYFDAFGRLNFRSYLSIIKHIWLQSSQADFQAGTNVNNTDAVAVPGALVLSNVAGVYANEGNWYSVLSPVLAGKVQFDSLLASMATGPSTSIDLFLRVTNNGGSTFTPWRRVIPQQGGLISKWNQFYGQIQLWARLRTSDTTTTPQLLDFTVRYTSRGGSQIFSNTPDWSTKDTTTLLELERTLTDTIGGTNYLVSRSIVKSTPVFPSSGAVTAWQGTYNGAAISPTNPMSVPVSQVVTNFPATSLSVNAIQLPSSIAATASVTGVFLQSDPSEVGTNFFSTGSDYDPTTGVISLATPLPNSNTAVLIRYTTNLVILIVDFGSVQYAVPQVVNMTVSSGAATAVLSNDPSKPTLTITATAAAVITDLTISGSPFVKPGTIQAISDAPREIKDDYGVNEDTLQNDYIDNIDLAQSIANNTIGRFGQGPLDWIDNADLRFSPNAQLNDRVTVIEKFSKIADDYGIMALTDKLVINSQSKTFSADTMAQLVKIGAGAVATVPAYFGGGTYFYGEFDNGGDGRLT